MKLNQLFYEIPPMEVIYKLLNSFGLTNINDSKEFNKGDLVTNHTAEKIKELIPDLALYYLPCKANIYLTNITIKRTITILSQHLRLYDYKLNRDERIVDGKKDIFYRIIKEKDTKLQIQNERETLLF
jgi:hypothetical protein|tara:strand:+ start:4220 stop:4603 length:384 start_codon:yes stop_codon:yes gene_type:complete